ncbi:MAG: DUF4157 domain-containing protein, partial [Myxococcota bacterium]
ASEGVQGSGGQLPHLNAIQHSFGRHDVTNVSSHTGGAAEKACDSMGALAYATGNSVAFKKSPDLHTAAHEAAHIVQQRAGVSLKGGVGQVGDRYEQHADAVADAVVQGKSAEGILDKMAGGSASGGVQRVVQKTGGEGGTNAQGNYEDHGNVGQAGMTSQSPDGVSVGVSTENGGTLAVGREWTIWSRNPAPPPIPIAAVPGLFLTITPEVKAGIQGQAQGLESGPQQRQYQVSVTGTVQVGLEYGAPPAASVYLRAGPVLQASMQGTFDGQGLQSVMGSLNLDAQVTLGAQAGSGAFDYSIVLARANLLRFTAFSYVRGRGVTWGNVQPGQDIINGLRWAKRQYERARQLAQAGGRAVRRVGRAISDGWNWLTGG